MDIFNRRIIPLDQAVGEIKQACLDAPGGNSRSPFFYFVGSGVSHPSIPLAPSIQADCEARAAALGRAESPSSTDSAAVYSHWFKAAFPHRVQRQQYLRDLIRNAPITHANFRLAHLLLQPTISNIVVTPNFDDLLSRALNLFGLPHIICDDPRTVERIDPEKPDVQLVHVHGSYCFYDCRNTSEEIQDRAKPQLDTTLTMAALLDKILAFRAPLVIGYSGWESDVFMTSLRRRLLTPLPYNLYWFCYRRGEVETLPRFLREHPDVYFVVPSQLPDDDADRMSIDSNRPEPVLSARKVFDTMIAGMGLSTPELAKDPLGFFAGRLRWSLPCEDVEDNSDIYSLRSVIDRVERARTNEARTVQRVEGQLERMRDAMRRAQYSEAVNEASRVSIDDLDVEQLRELMGALDTASRSITDILVRRLPSELIISAYETLEQRGIDSISLMRTAATAMGTKANAEFGEKKYIEAIGTYDDIISKFGNIDDEMMREIVLTTLNNKGLTYRVLKKYSKAIGAYDQVIRQCRNDEFLSVSDVYVVALALKSHVFVLQGKIPDAMSLLARAEAIATTNGKVSDYAKSVLNKVQAAVIMETPVAEKDLSDGVPSSGRGNEMAPENEESSKGGGSQR